MIQQHKIVTMDHNSFFSKKSNWILQGIYYPQQPKTNCDFSSFTFAMCDLNSINVISFFQYGDEWMNDYRNGNRYREFSKVNVFAWVLCARTDIFFIIIQILYVCLGVVAKYNFWLHTYIHSFITKLADVPSSCYYYYLHHHHQQHPHIVIVII